MEDAYSSSVARIPLMLRPLQTTDATTLASWAGDETFCAHAGWSPNRTRQEMISRLEQLIAQPDPKLLRFLALDRAEAVGYVDLYGEGDTDRELGYVIGPSNRWGHGLRTAAARAGLAHGFTVLGLQRIWAEAVEANLASVQVLRRIGMTETGIGEVEDFLGRPSRYLQFEIRSHL